MGIPAVLIDKATAAEALRSRAFPVTDIESADHGRTLIHCFLGGIGCDWDLDDALRTLAGAKAVGWINDLFGHDLAIEADGKVYRFDVPHPPELDGES